MTMGDREDRIQMLAQAMEQIIAGVRSMNAAQQRLHESRRRHEELFLIHEARLRELHELERGLEEELERTNQTVQGLLTVAAELQAEVVRLGSS